MGRNFWLSKHVQYQTNYLGGKLGAYDRNPIYACFEKQCGSNNHCRCILFTNKVMHVHKCVHNKRCTLIIFMICNSKGKKQIPRELPKRRNVICKWVMDHLRTNFWIGRLCATHGYKQRWLSKWVLQPLDWGKGVSHPLMMDFWVGMTWNQTL